FISAPAEADTTILQNILNERGLSVLIEQGDVKSDLSLGKNLLNAIVSSDFFIGVLQAGVDNSMVYYEIGIADGTGKRTLIFTSPSIKNSVKNIKGSLYMRVAMDNREGMEFAIDQVIKAPEIEPKVEQTEKPKNKPIGKIAKDLLAELSKPESTWGAHPEDAVIRALGSSGVNVLVRSKYWDSGADMALWADELEGSVGNPLLIEVKQHISGSTSITRLANQLDSYLESSNAGWLLLLYLKGPEDDSDVWKQFPDSVIHLPVPKFLQYFEESNLVEIVKSLKTTAHHRN
ncbi:MAG: hypothetical protein IIB41_00330, partial [Candidatus Marinimicrobia bacterium]|nr:hypothetical protein [Candidatus Neomarinimicrobiota bacterium]